LYTTFIESATHTTIRFYKVCPETGIMKKAEGRHYWIDGATNKKD